jgi:Domain of unknown function (DUF4190)
VPDYRELPGPPQPGAAFPGAAYPLDGYPGAGYHTSGYGGYAGYGAQSGPYYPALVAGPTTNGLSIAAMVVAIVGAALLPCYGVGGLMGAVGAILGHVARRQIRQRGEGGAGMALTGIIVGWVATGLALVIVALIVVAVVAAVNQAPYGAAASQSIVILRASA